MVFTNSIARAVGRFLVEGTLTSRIADIRPLREAADALRVIETDPPSGARLILKP